MKEKQNKISSKVVLHFIAIVLTVVTIVSLALGLFAWSRYTAIQNGNATAEVAKWNFNVSLKKGDNPVTLSSGAIDLATTTTHVADGKIAPGTSGQFNIIVDTRGTEVSLNYDVNITMTNCPRNITFSKKGPGENSFTVISAGGAENNANGGRTISFNKDLSLSDVTTANTNNKTFVETIAWDWPYELTGNNPATNQPYTAEQKNAYDLRDNADQGKSVTLDIAVTGTEILSTGSNSPQEDQGVGTPVGEAITTSDYGKYVNIGTTILSTYADPNNLPELADMTDSSNDNNVVYADWRVFHKDANGMYLILADNLPVGSGTVGASVVSGVGLKSGNTTGVYNNDGITRKQFIDRLNADWSGLITGTALASKSGVQVKGAIDLGTWIDSWNVTHATEKFYKSAAVATADGNGYNISGENNPPANNEYRAMVQEDADYNVFLSGLYAPHEADYGGIYWLSTPSVESTATGEIMLVSMPDGVGISGKEYLWAEQGVRPVIFVPNAVKIDKTNSVYTIHDANGN